MTIINAKLDPTSMSDRETRDLARKEKRDTPTPKQKSRINSSEKCVKGWEGGGCRKKLEISLDELSKDLTECKLEESIQKQYEHPVWKEISRKNGKINRADLSSLKHMCKLETIDSSGKLSMVRQRLKNHFRTKMLREVGLLKPSVHKTFDYFLVVDFEATCESKNLSDYPHEIIEFPGVLVDGRTGEQVSSWRRYVRPVINCQLSEFCTSLTGISQETVDSAEPFPQVLAGFSSWLSDQGLCTSTGKTMALVTDGPFDVGRFLRLNCSQSGVPVPRWAHRWVNIRKSFANFYRSHSGGYEKLPGLQNMLEKLGMEFEGSPHSGLDDAKNIARVVSRLIGDGAVIRVNERLEPFPTLCPQQGRSGGKTRLQHVAPVNRADADTWFQQCKDQAIKGIST